MVKHAAGMYYKITSADYTSPFDEGLLGEIFAIVLELGQLGSPGSPRFAILLEQTGQLLPLLLLFKRIMRWCRI